MTGFIAQPSALNDVTAGNLYPTHRAASYRIGMGRLDSARRILTCSSGARSATEFFYEKLHSHVAYKRLNLSVGVGHDRRCVPSQSSQYRLRLA